MNPRPAWLPTVTEIERQVLVTLVVTLCIAVVVAKVPAARRLLKIS